MLDEQEKAYFRDYQPDEVIPITPRPVMLDAMTLRDYFAGQSLAGMMATRVGPAHKFHPIEDAQHCYRIADAMLAEREKPQPTQGDD